MMSDRTDDETELNDNLSVNPELPEEFLGESIQNLGCYNIGDTVFSKKWVIQTVMKLLEVLKEETIPKNDGEQIYPVELDEGLESVLCKLWDMTIHEDVGKYLFEICPLDMLLDAISTTNAPRLMEICAGILANLACHRDIRKLMVHNERLQKMCFALLHSTDPPTLSELMRLFEVLCSNSDSCHTWLNLWDDPEMWDRVAFIMSSSKNTQLLKNTGRCVDCILDGDDHLRASFANPQLLGAVLDAINELGFTDHQALEGHLHMLHLFPDDVLVQYADAASKCCISYLEAVLKGDASTARAIQIASVWRACSSLLCNSNDTGFPPNLTLGKIIECFTKSCALFREVNTQRKDTSGRFSGSESKECLDMPEVLDSALLSVFDVLTENNERMEGFLAGLSTCEKDEIFCLLQFVQDNGRSGKFLNLQETKWSQETQKIVSIVCNYFGKE